MGHSGCQLLLHLERKDLWTPLKASRPGFRNVQSSLPEQSLPLPAHQAAHSSCPSRLMLPQAEQSSASSQALGSVPASPPAAHTAVVREGFAGPEDRPSGVRRRPCYLGARDQKGAPAPCPAPCPSSRISAKQARDQRRGMRAAFDPESRHVDWPRWQRQA